MAIPQSGERVVRVNDKINLKWTSNDIVNVKIYIQNNNNSVKEIISSTSVKNGQTNSYTWNVTEQDKTQFAGQICNIIIEMVGDASIKDISGPFWILDSLTV